MGEKSLYDRLGGEPAIKAVVDEFVARGASDPKVNFTREGHPNHWNATPENTPTRAAAPVLRLAATVPSYGLSLAVMPVTETLAAAIEKFEGMRWDQQALRRHAEQFDQTVFAFRVLQFLGSVAPSSCAGELLNGARLLSQNLSQRVWPRLALVG